MPFNFAMRAVDGNGNTVTSYAGTVHFTTDDPAGVVPADYTFTAADAGVHAFSATLSGNNVSARSLRRIPRTRR